MFTYSCDLCGIKREYSNKNTRNVARCKHFKSEKHLSKQLLKETREQYRLTCNEQVRQQIKEQYQTIRNQHVIKKIEHKNQRKKDKLVKKVKQLEHTLLSLIKHIKYPKHFPLPSIDFSVNKSPKISQPVKQDETNQETPVPIPVNKSPKISQPETKEETKEEEEDNTLLETKPIKRSVPPPTHISKIPKDELKQVLADYTRCNELDDVSEPTQEEQDEIDTLNHNMVEFKYKYGIPVHKLRYLV